MSIVSEQAGSSLPQFHFHDSQTTRSSRAIKVPTRLPALEEEIRRDGSKDQRNNQPPLQLLPHLRLSLLQLLPQGGLRADIGVHRILGLFQTKIPLRPHKLDRLDHVASPQQLNRRVGKSGRLSRPDES